MPLLRLADKHMNGTLAETVQRYRDDGVSWSSITRILARHGVEVSAKTLRESWAPELGISENGEAA